MSRRRSCCLALALLWALARGAHAQESAPPTPTEATEARAAKPLQFALGASLGLLRQRELGAETETLVIPSLLGLAYVPLAPRVYLRPGVRIGYVGLDQPEHSAGARIDERGVQGTVELGVLYDAWLVPAFALGAGSNVRWIDFVAGDNVMESIAIDRTEVLGLVYAQAGIGLPLFGSAVVVEPYLRLQVTFADDRALFQYGADLTFGL
ncbi:MAG: hypothetical protein ABW217_01820 [Polyangiaceae bacterium]